ncbi:MAG: hypothetical protein ACE5H4_00090 [Candidatus Thorarchaeota archaeon]
MKEYYSSVADEYEAIYERDLPGLRTEQEVLMEALMNIMRGKRVLDVACGTGY